MTEPNSIVTAGIGDLFPFVVFVIIVIAQIIKRAQKAGVGQVKVGTAKPPHPQTSSPALRQQQAPRAAMSSADEELRSFLEELSGVKAPPKPSPQPQRTVPPPPPPPIPKPKRPQQTTARAAMAKARKPTPAAKPASRDHAPVHQPAQPAGVAGVAAVAAVAGVADVSDWGQRRSATTSTLRRGLKDRKSLRDAILHREILGPPLALRDGELPRK